MFCYLHGVLQHQALSHYHQNHIIFRLLLSTTNGYLHVLLQELPTHWVALQPFGWEKGR